MSDENRIYGYVRVSSKCQNENRQVDALVNYGVPKRDIFIDKASGKNFEDRTEYAKMKSLLQRGDTLAVLDLDRLGRGYHDMAKEWREITGDKGCDIVILNYPILSTVNHNDNNLDNRFIADMIFGLLSYVAERERLSIRERQKEGIESAMKHGVRFGRPRIPRPDNFEEIYQKTVTHELTSKKAMEILQLKPNTYYEFVREFKTKK